MKDVDVSSFLKKAEELKALFVLGQRVIPFLEEIFIFVKDIKPILDDINSSIEENLKKMPNASKQLSKVTEATELATTEIMDVVDGIVYKSGVIANNIKQLGDAKADKTVNPIKVYEIVQKAVQEDADMNEIMPQLSMMIENLKSSSHKDSDDLVKQSNDLINSIQNDSNSIMMSLQVQDITSQQIAAVNHMIETIHDKLESIMTKFQTSGMNEMLGLNESVPASANKNITQMHRTIAFDPNAVDSLSKDKTRQTDVDNLINAHNESNSEISSQDDIDALFADVNSASKDPVGQDDIDALFAEVNGGSNDPVGQEDIDALFANSADPIKEEKPKKEHENKFAAYDDKKIESDNLEQVSQDDIDALFGNSNL